MGAGGAEDPQVNWRGLVLATSGEVYEPAEDSFLLASALEEDAPGPRPGEMALEVGCGTGLATLVLARRGYRVVAVDVNPAACGLARLNAKRNGVASRVDVVLADMDAALAAGVGFAVAAFNAPYLPSGPEERLEGVLDRAFHGGEEGAEVALEFVKAMPRVLRAEGSAYLVLSTRGNVERVLERARNLGFSDRLVNEERFFFEAVQTWCLRRRVE